MQVSKRPHRRQSFGVDKLEGFPSRQAMSKAALRQASFLLSRGLQPSFEVGEADRPRPLRRSRAKGRSRAAHLVSAKIRSRLPYLTAFRDRQRLAATADATADAVWQELGPTLVTNGQTYGSQRTLVSGRVARVAIDPSDAAHVLIASAGGGVWAVGMPARPGAR